MNRHIGGDDRGVALREPLLAGKKVALAIGGGIAATESLRLIRMLRRYGADVEVYVSQAALEFITPTALEWASLRAPITTLSGEAEHLFKADLLLVAPATLNLISKAALGIADSLLTTLIASALGSMAIERKMEVEASTKRGAESSPVGMNAPKQGGRVLMVPSMHASLAAHPKRKVYQDELSRMGVDWLRPLEAEGKWKTPSVEEIVYASARTSSVLAKTPIWGKKVLITAGPVSTPIDPVREITNHASGRTGLDLAWFAYAMGAEVTLLIAKSKLPVSLFPQDRKNPSAHPNSGGESLTSPSKSDNGTSISPFPFETIPFADYDDYTDKVFRVLGERSPELGVFTAAVSDYRAKTTHTEKISSDALSVIELEMTEKVIRKVSKKYPSLTLISFKLETTSSVETLIGQAETRLEEEKYACVVANLLEDVREDVSSATRYVVIPQETIRELPQLTGGATLHIQKTGKKIPVCHVIKVTTHFDLAQILFRAEWLSRRVGS